MQWQYNDLPWLANEKVSTLSFPGESATNSPTPKGSKAWLGWEGNPNQESGIGYAQQPALRLRYTRFKEEHTLFVRTTKNESQIRDQHSKRPMGEVSAKIFPLSPLALEL